MRVLSHRSLRALLGLVLGGCLLASTPSAHAGRLVHIVFKPVLARTTLKGGCCDLRIDALSQSSVAVSDQVTKFSAIADHLFLTPSRFSGFELLWVYVNEQNAQSVTSGLNSGARNWLIKDADGIPFAAFAAVPHRHAGQALARISNLQADTDPANEGWIFFRFPSRVEGPFTLYWSDCQPGCASRGQDYAYSPIANVILMRNVTPSGPSPR